ncbi:ATP-binding protein [Hymenobacter sp. 5516J-16]|uniref:ATP-binding protein n=1 Tax=Hymenobacter sublimis TaxID=2933777 RepID=A0ABY4J9W8_9BACT|nr:MULTISPECIES: ATP-binding protein [Hymenobacter]UOQ75934.1 ATP-binding protein [Hymenobacter sp. 5516J-16]UPL49614.1 ATP-binding protein [Hymenobacter sublimis]
MSKLKLMTKEDKLLKLDDVFSPTAPIEKRDLFYGRIGQLSDLYSAVTQRGAHAVLYGDRGVGKTSLANMATTMFPDVVATKVTCNRTEDFKTIWQEALKKIRFYSSSKSIGFKAEIRQEAVQLDLFLPPKDEIDSSDILQVFENLSTKLLIIFDEFDSITDENIRTRMADTIKALSDNVPNVTILIVGIADSVGALLGEHPSLERCLMQIQMPRMSDEELKEIIDNGLKKLELEIIDNVRDKIIEYSSGFPHYTHAICKSSAWYSINQDVNTISLQHFTYAVKRAIHATAQSLRNSYQKAIINSKGPSHFEEVLAACASAKLDEYDCFTNSASLAHFKGKKKTKSNMTTSDFRYYLDALCKNEKGPILEKIGQGVNLRYKFINPMMRAFIRLKVYEKRHESNKVFEQN